MGTSRLVRPLRNQLHGIDRAGERPLVDHDLLQIRKAVVLVLVADIEIARKAFLVVAALLDPRAGFDQLLEILRLQLAREKGSDPENEQQAREHDQPGPQEQVGALTSRYDPDFVGRCRRLVP